MRRGVGWPRFWHTAAPFPSARRPVPALSMGHRDLANAMSSIEQTLRRHIRDSLPGASGLVLDDDLSLIDAGILDSIGVLSLVTWLEKEFGIFVEDHEVIPENIDGIGALVRFVEAKRAELGLDR
ncbi:MAG: acyl carrier protein [Dokdonella sp.]|nr:MAG: acyl carrier protein [Gammaproteobacteria bacterium]TXI71840.1 MAG: acyl carrier protein [Dokdonella sp.]